MPASHHNHPEPEERAPACRLVKFGKHWPSYPAEWTARIERTAMMQQQLQDAKALGRDWSDKQFTEDLNKIANVWPSMRLGLYPLPSTATAKTKWLAELDALENRAKANIRRIGDADARQQRSLAGFVETRDYKAVKSAIEKAKKRATTHNQDRGVAYIAKTGAGKTTLAMRLMEDGIVDWYADATPSWKRSYRAFLLSLAETWSIAPQKRQSTLDLETEIIRHARTLSGVLLIEEVDSLCSSSQEFLKLLLNRSTLVICLFMTPEASTTLRSLGGSQLAQLFRRFEAQITASPLKPEEAPLFAPEVYSRMSSDQLKIVTENANAMGGVDAVKRIAANVIDLGGTSGQVTDETLTKAVKLYRMAVPVIATKMERRAA